MSRALKNVRRDEGGKKGKKMGHAPTKKTPAKKSSKSGHKY